MEAGHQTPPSEMPGVCVVDAQGHVLSWNAGAERLTGWPAGEILGCPFPVDCPESHDGVCQTFLAGLAAAEPEGFPIFLRGRHGATAEYRVAASPINGTDRHTVLLLRTSTPNAAPVDRRSRSHIATDASNDRGRVSRYGRDLSDRKRAEDALRASEERYRSLFTGMTEGFALHEILCDEQGVPCDYRFLEVNPAFEELTGLKRENVVGKTLAQVLPNEDAIWVREYGRVAITGEPVHFENYSPSLDRHYDIYAYRPAPRQFAVVFTDITERKKTEHALRESEEKFSTAFQATPYALVISRVSDGTIREVNEAFVELFGWSRDEVIGRSSLELGMFVDPAQRDHAIKQLRRDGCVRDYSVKIRRRSGEERDASLTVEMVQMRGEPVLLTIVRDISARRQMEEALRESEERFRTLADNIAQLAWIADAGGSITWMNQRWYDYTGLNLREFTDTDRRLVHHPDHIDRVGMHFQRSIKAGEPWEDVFPLRGRDGNYRWFLSRALPIRDEEGTIVRWFGTNTDITERMEMEEELRNRAAKLAAADRAKDEFLAMLAHELRNPLGAIGNAAALIELQVDTEPRLRKPVDILNRQVRHTARLVDDLLDVSRITQGKMTLRKELMDLNAVVQRASETARPHMESYGHSFTVSVPSAPLWMEGDTARLEQVIGNLLSNSAKYTDQGGHVALTLTQEDDGAVIRLQDDGQGISAEMLPRVFDLFAQEDQSLARSKGGLGIGLTLVKKLVEMHGGIVEAQSAGPGQGSDFTVRLPLLGEDGSVPTGPQGRQVQRDAGEPTERRCGILVVEDNQDAAATLADVMESWGHVVRVVHDGPAALETVREWMPEVVLLDIGLPGMNGYDVARALRREYGTAGLRLVALTGYGQEDDRQKATEAGFDEHLVKPVDARKLRAILSSG